MVKYGRWTKIDSILLMPRSVRYPKKNHRGQVVERYKMFTPLKLNHHPIEGTPKQALFRHLDIGFEKMGFKARIFSDLLAYGYTKGYWNDDRPILKVLFKAGASRINKRYVDRLYREAMEEEKEEENDGKVG